MTADQLIEKFDLLASVNGAVEAIRSLVLEATVTSRLNEHRDEWPSKQLKELTTKIGSGATPSGGRQSYVESGTPLIRSMNVHFYGFEPSGLAFLSEEQASGLANVIVEPDDVLLNITGASIGRVTTAPPEMAGARVNQHVMIIRPRETLLPQFLAKHLASPSVQVHINEIQVGATRQALTKGKVERFKIPLPPLAEQKRIVAKVDELMALLDRLEEQLAEREARHAELARAALARFAADPTPANLEYLFHESFDIEPADLRKSILTMAVRGRLVEQQADEEPAVEQLKRMCDPEPADRRSPRGMYTVPADLLELPKGWAYAPLADIFSVLNGRAYKKSELLDKGMPVLRVGNLFTSKDWYYSDLDLEPEKYCDEGDLLFAWSASFGPFIWQGPKVIYHYHIWKLEPHSTNDIDRAYLRLFLQHETEEIKASGHGLAMIHMTKAKMERLPVALPPLAEQIRIVAKVDQLMTLVDRLETEQVKAQAVGKRLLEAAVAELTQPQTEAA